MHKGFLVEAVDLNRQHPRKAFEIVPSGGPDPDSIGLIQGDGAIRDVSTIRMRTITANEKPLAMAAAA